MIRNTNTGNQTAKADRSSQEVPSRVAGPLSSHAPLDTVVVAQENDDEPFLEDNADTGNPALNKVLLELRSCLKANDKKGGDRTDDGKQDHCYEDEIKLAESWNALGLIRIHMQQKTDEARKCHLRALEIYNKHKKNNAVATATTLKDLGFCYEKLTQHGQAIKMYRDAVDILKGEKVPSDNLLLNATLRSIARLSPSRR